MALSWLCQGEAQLHEHRDPADVTGRAGDMSAESSLTPPGLHGASAALCLSLVLPTSTLAVAGEPGTQSSRDSPRALRNRPYAVLVGCGTPEQQPAWKGLPYIVPECENTEPQAELGASPLLCGACSQAQPRLGKEVIRHGRTVMTDGRRNCLLQMATWELSRSGEVKPSVQGRKWEHEEEVGGTFIPRRAGDEQSRAWLLLGALGCSVSQDGPCISPHLELVRACVVMCQVPGGHAVLSLPSSLALQSLDIWCIFPAFRCITPATSIYNFVSLTTVSCV